MTIYGAERLKKLPPYLFAEIDRMRRELVAKGENVINLGVGDPDLPTPGFIIDVLERAARDPRNHQYALDQGMAELREAIAEWYRLRFGVSLDPMKEILPLIGSKEGIAHLPLAVLNPGEVSLVPDPCYPPYRSGTWFAGGEVVSLPLLEENGFLPNLKATDPKSLKKAKLIYLNYPNNPTGACASIDFFRQAAAFAEEHGLVVCHDAAYSEIYFDGQRPPSFLQAEGAKETGVEFHSLSKTFNMTGWRIGFACGSADVISHLGKIKSNIDSGIFQAIQWAGIEALRHGAAEAEQIRKVYEKRRDLVLRALHSIGWKANPLKATFYVWVKVPKGYSSQQFCFEVLKKSKVVVIPGNGFGEHGEGYFRLSLTIADARLEEAVDRLRKALA